jgi:hypothetical protein
LVVTGFFLQGLEFGLSVLIGGVLADLNFSLMKETVDQVLAGKTGLSARRLLVGFVGRVLLILLCLFAMIHFSFFRLLGVVLGASIFVLSGFIEATVVLFRRQY